MRTHYTNQLRLDFQALPFGQPIDKMQARDLLVPLPVAAVFVRRSPQMVEIARRGPHGIEHVREGNRIFYTVGGLLDYCSRRGHAPNWSALRPAVALDAGRPVRLAADVAAEHVRPCHAGASWASPLLAVVGR